MLIRVKRKLRNPDAPQRHDNHRRPMTRRELIAQGFMTGGAAVLSTGLFSLFANPRTALAQLAEDLALDATALGCGNASRISSVAACSSRGFRAGPAANRPWRRGAR